MSVFRLNGLLVQAGEGITGPLGESSARWQVIGRVAFEGKTVAQLAREIGHARQSVQRVANRLAADGLVTYRPHPRDARTQLVQLTETGQQTLRAIYQRQVEWSDRIVRQLDTARLEELVQTLQSVGDVVAAELTTSPDTTDRRRP